MKKLTVFLFLFISSFLVKPVFAGNDITITCNTGSDCIKSSELPLFSENNIYPGYSVSQVFSVDNNRNGPCHLTFKADSLSKVPDILSQKILINISGINNDYSLVNYSLNDLLDPAKSSVSLGHINKNIENKYSWSATFDKDANNEYQSLTSNFNINFNFECDEETGDNPLNISDNPSSNQGTAQCTNSAPDAPTHLVAYRNTNGSIRLTWDHTISDHTGYLIAFGISSGNYQYGAPDVSNVSTYTVEGLTPGAQYCFYVRSLNGCMPGGRTPEYCINPGSTIIPLETNPPTGFESGVLGAITESPIPTESNGNTLGANTDCTHRWLPLLFIVAFLINLIYIRYIRKYKITPFLISLMFFLIDQYILKSRCCFGPSWFCNYFWIGNILSWILPISIKFKKVK